MAVIFDGLRPGEAVRRRGSRLVSAVPRRMRRAIAGARANRPCWGGRPRWRS